MNCPNCQRIVPSDDYFCSYCGTELYPGQSSFFRFIAYAVALVAVILVGAGILSFVFFRGSAAELAGQVPNVGGLGFSNANSEATTELVNGPTPMPPPTAASARAAPTAVPQIAVAEPTQVPTAVPLEILAVPEDSLSIAVAEPTPIPTAVPFPTPAIPEGSLTIAVNDLGFVNPVPWHSGSIGSIGLGSLRFIYDPMFEVDDGDLAPGLVESWEVRENGTEWLFNLRQGIPFHNGGEFRAQDVEFSYRKWLDERGASASNNKLESLELIDDYTIVARTRNPDAWMPWGFAAQRNALGMPVSKEHYEQEGAEGFARNPVGTGPYGHTGYNQSTSLELEATRFHWRVGVPAMNGVRFLEVPEYATRLAALQTGQVDITDLLHEDVLRIRRDGLQVFLREGWTTVGFHFHQQWDNVPIADPRVRWALNLAVDRRQLADVFFDGMARPASVPVGTTGSTARVIRNHSLEPYSYDPDVARFLLAEAGYPDGFELTIHAFHRRPTDPLLHSVELADALASYYEDIGVEAYLNVVDYSSFHTQLLEQNIPGDMSYGNYNAGSLPWVFRQLAWLYQSDSHFTTARDEELDYLISTMAGTFDRGTAVELLLELLSMTHDNANYVPLLHVDQPHGASHRVPADWDLGSHYWVPDYLDAVRRR